MGIFEARGDQFIYDHEPIQLISGAVHYFRIVPEYWRDRLLKLKACGFNTVETYVPWNFHEPKPGKFRFGGMADIERFLRIAAELGLHVIVRPSPYICAEWEFGGLPAWLLADSDMQLRCHYKPFLDRVDAYYDELMPRLAPFQCTKGGPIIAMQIENEYGSYGNDGRYLRYLKDAMIRRGVEVLLFTSDGPTDALLQGGSVPGVLATANFGSSPASSFAKLREYEAEGPLMCMEYWNGWFDHWGKPHHTRDAEDVAAVFGEMLAAGASVNFYMFHGGTNFGFCSGANAQLHNHYEPTATSYDYDAPLDETGQPTAKYGAVREAIARHTGVSFTPAVNEELMPAPAERIAYGVLEMQEQGNLFGQLDALSEAVRSTVPLPMEKVGQSYGFIVYTTRISGPRPMEQLHVQEVRDRALVFVNEAFVGVIERAEKEQTVSFEVPAGGAELRIVVENMGRINYGPYLKDRKGITEGVRLGFQFLFDWSIHPLPLEDVSAIVYGEAAVKEQKQPFFCRAHLDVERPADTFIDMSGWTKGVVFVNGFNLGRYWSRGPQKTLYVPAPLLQEGANEIIVFELHGTTERAIRFTDSPMLDGDVKSQ
ncbi:glycoside hydrolase family 35 protein [Paenibacillus harenae]|uniref:Beta-galactosidase n=1 Tax=Paenibacillus harenae TaxID=306543 RepID=A0ABT9U810_PAEHA|nr:beta-galactosidase family protein [Paenibacillus harenae]MDQ0115798.1 beta-galactosidase [Paenibacillus harenae]